jgi:hypothetical protein
MSLLCLLLMLGGSAVLVAAPAAIDLVERAEHPSAWWALPFVLWPLPILVGVLIPAFEPAAFDRATAAAALGSVFHLAGALFFTLLALGLAASRGLRPGGRTRRRWRTSVVACLLVPAAGVLALLGFWTSWGALLPGIAWFWVLALNRRGPQRLELGKAWSASLLVAAALQAAFTVAHQVVLDDLEAGPPLFTSNLAVWGVAVVLGPLVAGLRYLAGAIPWPFPVLSLATGLSLLGPLGLWALRETVPAGVTLPAAVDLRGEPFVPTSRVLRPECFWQPGDPVEQRWPCAYNRYVLAPPDLALDQLPPEPRIVVGEGLYALRQGTRWNGSLIVVEQDGRASIEGRPGSFALDATLHAELAGAPSVLVRRTPAWTVADLVAICGSVGPDRSCGLDD